MSRRSALGSLLALLLGTAAHDARGATVAKTHLPQTDDLDRVVAEAVAAGRIPGAVVVAAVQGKVVYRKATGNRAIVPDIEPMTLDTLFDIASLTKVVATTTAAMQLAERGKLDLDAPVASVWPAFAGNGKGAITVRHLMTHYSGLPAGLPERAKWSGYEEALALVVAMPARGRTGHEFCYSDVDYIVLGEVVRRAAGVPLDQWAATEIFAPLGMTRTAFRPTPDERALAAPMETSTKGGLKGTVHDTTARLMGGVSGHAGVFTTADDLSRFAQAIVSGGTVGSARLLSRESVAAMTSPQSPPGALPVRGLGWDIESPYASVLAPGFSPRSFGHTGFTGTALWIDPETQSWLIVLTNRLHPDGKGVNRVLNRRAAAAVGARANATAGRKPVLTGIDVLEGETFRRLDGRTVGLLTNATGRTAGGERTVDALARAKGLRLATLLSPEHGLETNLDQAIASGTDRKTGLTVHSLYGETKRPTPEMLAGLDTLVFDIQDAGARFYTYATTMGYAMEAAAEAGIDFVVLDRPNPISADIVQGPMLDPDLLSFIGYLPMPVRHGMTLGELARLFAGEHRTGVKLTVVPMRYYTRAMWFDDTGIAWINPSPNLRSVTQAALYPGVALLESANVSVGRGTDTPFEVLGAPWIDGAAFAAYLNTRKISGTAFAPRSFTPASGPYAGKACGGISISVVDRAALDSPALGIELIAALIKLFPGQFDTAKTLTMIGSRSTHDMLASGADPSAVIKGWAAPLTSFRKLREPYLIYG
ncbi:MAG: DUF1343 domain-containing protein [Hyphomicrobiales bacterium]